MEIDFRASLPLVPSSCHFNCLAGIAPPGVDNATLRRTFVENLHFVANALKEVGVKPLIKPINNRADRGRRLPLRLSATPHCLADSDVTHMAT